MTTLALIQARMGSSRFPGKMLTDLCGKPLLQWCVEGAAQIPGADKVAVATSAAASDDAIAAWCRSNGVACHRGSEDDVLDRFYQAAKAEKAKTVLRLVGDRMKVLASEPGSQTLLPQGVGDGLRKAFEKAKEAIARAIDLPGFLVSRAVVEARKPINDFATLFLGDVFAYLGNRDEAGTSIAARVLGRLAEARDAAPGEPLIVLSHSMGGQVVYDLVTHYIAASPEHSGLKIDFWCATASQVALFAELDLFRMRRPDYGAGKPNPRLPHPDAGTLGYWWNVWDQNDFISYTGGQIFEGIDDEEFVSGMSVLSAHGGYLARPNFFRRFADKVKAAKQANWRNL